jgi:hypothetical protein
MLNFLKIPAHQHNRPTKRRSLFSRRYLVAGAALAVMLMVGLAWSTHTASAATLTVNNIGDAGDEIGRAHV